MGSVRLKAKDLHNYRKAGIMDRNCDRTCEDCSNFVYMHIPGIGEADLGKQYRCSVLGLRSSAKYRIRPDHVCNSFKPMGGFKNERREIKSCAECKPADMPCQVSRECKRERRNKHRGIIQEAAL